MRMSAATIKGRRHSLQDIPRPGTARRIIFDTLKPAIFVSSDDLAATAGIKNKQHLHSIITHLQVDYDLDIRYLGRRWCLVGEWNGRIYIDHLASALATPSDQARAS